MVIFLHTRVLSPRLKVVFFIFYPRMYSFLHRLILKLVYFRKKNVEKVFFFNKQS